MRTVNCLQVGLHLWIFALLLNCYDEYGADSTAKNKWGNTSADKAGSDGVCGMKMMLSLGWWLHWWLTNWEEGLVWLNTRIRQGDLVKHWNARLNIVCGGLMPNRTNLPWLVTYSNLQRVKDPLSAYGDKHFGISQTIFHSPSILHASHVWQIISEGTWWCVVVKGLVKPLSYKWFEPPVYNCAGLPWTSYSGLVRHWIIRVESTCSVVVISATFLENLGSSLIFDELQANSVIVL